MELMKTDCLAWLLSCYILVSSACVWAGVVSSLNLTSLRANREKRTLIFEGGGTLKFVIGPTLPVNFGDPIAWRSLICSINLHGGHYSIPTEPLYPWDKYEDIFARSMRKLRVHEDVRPHEKNLEEEAALQYWTDDARLFTYTVLENFLNRQTASKGRVCLLRSICENAQVQHHLGILAEVLNIVLTPGRGEKHSDYGGAFEAGKAGADCLKLYQDCPMGSNVLDSYIEYL